MPRKQMRRILEICCAIGGRELAGKEATELVQRGAARRGDTAHHAGHFAGAAARGNIGAAALAFHKILGRQRLRTLGTRACLARRHLAAHRAPNRLDPLGVFEAVPDDEDDGDEDEELAQA